MKADQYPYHNSYVVILCLYVMPRPCLVLEVCVEGEGGLVYLSVSQNDLCLWVCGPWVSWTEVFKSNACGGLCLVWGYHGYIWGKWLVYQYSICHLSEYFQNQWSNKFELDVSTWLQLSYLIRDPSSGQVMVWQQKFSDCSGKKIDL